MCAGIRLFGILRELAIPWIQNFRHSFIIFINRQQARPIVTKINPAPIDPGFVILRISNHFDRVTFTLKIRDRNQHRFGIGGRLTNGNVKFTQHSSVNPNLQARWRGVFGKTTRHHP